MTKTAECQPGMHEFTPPTIVKVKYGLSKALQWDKLTSICTKCGATRTWSV